MKSEIKIEDLRILQEVYLDGEKVIIESLSTSLDYGTSTVSFTSRSSEYPLEYLQEHLSLTPPKKTKRFWQWRINLNGKWYRPNDYYDENGNDTKMEYLIWASWHSIEKQKIEDDFIDIEVSE